MAQKSNIKKETFLGDDIVQSSVFKKIQKNLLDLIAETSIWAKPENVKLEPVYPNVRRGAPRDKGSIIDGIKIDDNTYANIALKNAISKTAGFKNYTVCHIWPGTTYDERYHTLVPNLVLIPRIIASLSDFCPDVINCLKYRAMELYGWYPEEEDAPVRPNYYPVKWRQFVEEGYLAENEIPSLEEYIEREEEQMEEDCCNEIKKVQRRVLKWLHRPNQINSIILITYMSLSDNDNIAVKRDQLQKAFEKENSDSFFSNYVQMKNFGLKNHGKVFEEDRMGNVRLWKPVSDFIREIFECERKSAHDLFVNDKT